MNWKYLWSFLWLLGLQVAYPQGLDVTIVLEKSSYLVGEEIWMDIIWQNNSPDTLSTANFAWNEDLYIIDSEGKRHLRTGMFVDLRGLWVPDLPPGATVVHTLECAVNMGDTNPNYRLSHLPASSYQIYIKGELTKGYQYPDWFKKIPYKSNTINLVINEPVGDERIVWGLLNQAEDYIFAQKNKPEADKLYETIISTYPNSAYIERTWQKYASLFKYSGSIEQREQSAVRLKEFIDRFPDSMGVSRRVIHLYMHSRVSPEQKLQLMNEISTAHPGTRAAAAAKRRLDELQAKASRDKK
ncbi:MAG: tetratricopeptide repeat protein [Fidelibacterota bacterium]|nr:MAG: tetratricopeptide repeat protein [Candidatus Neomarinimicrobiota bacterium]